MSPNSWHKSTLLQSISYLRWNNFIMDLFITNTQWWSVTKYNYFVTVLKYIFQVSVLYWSSFILSNFYFYFTTFQSIRSYFFYFTTFHKTYRYSRDTSRAPRRRSGVWLMNKLILFNEPVQSVRKSQQTIHSRIAMIRLQLFLSRKLTDSNDPFRASLLQWTELTSKEPRDLVSACYWCCEKYVTNVEF